jgi:uncharacterized membrane protein
MKYVITESQYSKAIDKFITYQLEPHEEKTSKEYPGSIFWVKDGELIVEIEKSKYFWVDYYIWETISRMFSLEDNKTQEVIKEWLKEHYKMGPLKLPFKKQVGYYGWKNITNWDD